MIIKDCPLLGVKTIQLKILSDNRGFFVELFNSTNFREEGLPIEFSQDNHSRSAPGILRGLHFQHTPAQGKLVKAIRGRILDVVVDIRPESSTFGQYYAEELSGENGLMLWIPSGFAHGFSVLGDEPADVLYKVTGLYNREGEGGIRYDDPALNINWGIDHPVVSERDQKLAGWKEYCANPLQPERI